MTTYPRPADPLNSLTRGYPATEAHSTDHGRVIKQWENVLAHGAKGDSVTDDTAAFQSAINAGGHVYVPEPQGGNYIIKNKLTISSPFGLRMVGAFPTPGTGNRILCNNFPANTDVFEMTNAANPGFHLNNLYFDHSSGTAPRDFFRLSVTDNHNINWRDVVISNMGGYAFNVPASLELVGARFDNVQVVLNGTGGFFIDHCTATTLRDCRFVGNGPVNGGCDLSIEGASSSGVTLDTLIMDGFWPQALNYDRVRLKNIAGLSILNPYVEWSSGASSGALRNFSIHTCQDVVITAGTGSVTPGSGGYTMTALDINNCNGVVLMEPPISTWRGLGAYGLKVTASAGVVAFVRDTDAAISVDASSASNTTIYNNGQLHRVAGSVGQALIGATPSIAGKTYGGFQNGGATNVTNITGGQSGQILTLTGDGNSTLKNGSGGAGQFSLRGAVDYLLPSGAVMQLTNVLDVWKESVR